MHRVVHNLSVIERVDCEIYLTDHFLEASTWLL